MILTSSQTPASALHHRRDVIAVGARTSESAAGRLQEEGTKPIFHASNRMILGEADVRGENRSARCWRGAAGSEARAPLILLKRRLPALHHRRDVIAAFEDRQAQRIEEVLERGPPSPQQVVCGRHIRTSKQSPANIWMLAGCLRGCRALSVGGVLRARRPARPYFFSNTTFPPFITAVM